MPVEQKPRLDSSKTDVVVLGSPPPKNVVPITKIAERLDKVVNDAPPTRNRSPELILLTADYEEMKRNLRMLVFVMKDHADTTDKVHASRDKVVQQLALMSEKTPIHEEIGSALDAEASEGLAMIRNHDKAGGVSVSEIAAKWERRQSNNNNKTSLNSLQQWASTQAVVNAREFQAHVVDYAVEWEQVVTERCDKELKEVRKLQADRAHYEHKLEGLRQRANDLGVKGKASPAKSLTKLNRNEDKLKEAYMVHEAAAGQLCVLFETVTQDGWKDLYYLAKNYMKWEANRVGRESDIYCQLAKTLESMKTTLKQNTSKNPKATKAKTLESPKTTLNILKKGPKSPKPIKKKKKV